LVYFSGGASTAMVNTFKLDLRDQTATPEQIQRIAEEMVAEGYAIDAAKVKQFTDEMLTGRVKLVQRDNGATVGHMFRGIEDWGERFRHMTWGLCEAPQDSAFITCDNPVLVVDEPAATMKFSEYRGPTRQVRYQYPISPKYMLTGEFINAHDQVMKIDAEWVRRANAVTILRAYKEVYASFRSSELQTEVDERHAKRKPIMPPRPVDD
jgi:hypothetical protein